MSLAGVEDVPRLVLDDEIALPVDRHVQGVVGHLDDPLGGPHRRLREHVGQGHRADRHPPQGIEALRPDLRVPVSLDPVHQDLGEGLVDRDPGTKPAGVDVGQVVPRHVEHLLLHQHRGRTGVDAAKHTSAP